MSDRTASNCAAPTPLGELAVEAGLLSREELESELRIQRDFADRGIAKPLGALLVERGRVRPEDLAQLLASQRLFRGERGPAPARLSEEENRILGEFLVWGGLVEEVELVEARRIQAELARRGAPRRMGEILIDRGLLDDVATEGMLLGEGKGGPGRSLHSWRPAPNRPDAGSSEAERAILEALREVGALAERHLDVVGPCAESLAAHGSSRSRLSLAIELGFVTREGIDSLADLVDAEERAPGRRRIESPVRLSREEEEYLAEFLEDLGLADEAMLAKAREVARIYESYGLARSAPEALAEVAGWDAATVGRAVAVARDRTRLARLYFGLPKSLSTTTWGRYRIERADPSGRAVAGARIDLGESDAVLVGRSALVGLRVPDPEASKVHARASIEGGRLRVRDLGSRYGTSSGSRRIEEVLLSSGETFRIGRTILTFLDASAPSPAPAPVGPTQRDSEGSAAGDSTASPEESTAEAPGRASDSEELERARLVFREFYEREPRLRETRLHRARRAKNVARVRPGSPIVSRPPRRSLAVRLVSALSIALAISLAVAAYSTHGRPAASGRDSAPSRRGSSPRGAAQTQDDEVREGQPLEVRGTIVELSRYAGPEGRIVAYDLVVEDGAGLRHVLGGAGDPPRDFAEGGSIAIRGPVRRFHGPPADLGNGRVAASYVEIPARR